MNQKKKNAIVDALLTIAVLAKTIAIQLMDGEDEKGAQAIEDKKPVAEQKFQKQEEQPNGNVQANAD